jgi:hypothetical protein
MQTKTTVKTTQSTTEISSNAKRICLWDLDQIFEASFMFPTKHFKDESELKKMPDEEFFLLLEEMLQVCQPISNEDAKSFAKIVFKGNRLRLYYQAYNYVQRSIDVSNELNVIDTDITELDDKELSEVFEKRGIQLVNNIPVNDDILDHQYETDKL